MKDIELLEILFRYMYDNGEVLYYERALRESGVDENLLTLPLVFKLHKLLLASGLVKEIAKFVEDHPIGLTLNDEGMNMMLQYGSYGHYLKEQQDEKKQELNYKKIKIKQIKINIIIAVISVIVTILLSGLLKQLLQLLSKPDE